MIDFNGLSISSFNKSSSLSNSLFIESEKTERNRETEIERATVKTKRERKKHSAYNL